MSLDQMDHFSIRTVKLEETREFHENVMDLKVGDHPPLPFPGYWLYLGDDAVILLVGIDNNSPWRTNDYLGEFAVSQLSGGGAVDRLAFRASDAENLVKRLKKHKVPYREHLVQEMNLYQLFVEDPNNITLELNYWDD